MTDWADEIAKKLVYMTNTSSERGIERANARLAAALRKARAEGITTFADAILHGDDLHREWLLDAADAFNNGRPMPPPRQRRAPNPPKKS